MTVILRPVTRDDYEQVRQLFIEAGWRQRVADRDRFERMLEGADRTVVALEDTRVVGFARALCDGATNGYISTVVVAGDRQGRGIGRRMIEHLMEVGEPGTITWVLRAGPGAEPFWEKMGFRRSGTAMEIIRNS